MKFLKLAMAAVFAFGFGSAYAFHSGGVAECEGCHVMHTPGSAYLLKGASQSEACLSCHEHLGDTGPSSYHISTADADMETLADGATVPRQLTPGGDFAWLKKSYTWTPRSGSELEEELGQSHGHNVNAPNYGYVNETRAAPGGTFPGGELECSSCHDPHGKWRRITTTITKDASVDGSWVTSGYPIWASGSYTNAVNNNPRTVANNAQLAVGAYRILGGRGYAPASYQSAPFSFQVPVAAAPSSYNRSEASTQTRVAYGSGMSEWCANCHTGFLGNTIGMGLLRHPAGNAALMTGGYQAWGGTSTIGNNYNIYRKTGDLTGTAATAYTSIVPFEVNSAGATIDFVALQGTARDSGTTATSSVSCMSCHRAHASGFKHMLRFDYGHEFMTRVDAAGNTVYASPDESATGPGQAATAQGRTPMERERAYYGRPATVFAPYQRVLCNKCHVKD